jgi:hypothetical protein
MPRSAAWFASSDAITLAMVASCWQGSPRDCSQAALVTIRSACSCHIATLAM